MQYLEQALNLLGAVPVPLWAVIAGLLVSWVGTQRLKWWVPEGRDRDRNIRLLSFLLGALPALTIWPGWGWAPIWGAIGTGFAAPTGYKLLVAWASDRWKWVRDLGCREPQQPKDYAE